MIPLPANNTFSSSQRGPTLSSSNKEAFLLPPSLSLYHAHGGDEPFAVWRRPAGRDGPPAGARSLRLGPWIVPRRDRRLCHRRRRIGEDDDPFLRQRFAVPDFRIELPGPGRRRRRRRRSRSRIRRWRLLAGIVRIRGAPPLFHHWIPVGPAQQLTFGVLLPSTAGSRWASI